MGVAHMLCIYQYGSSPERGWPVIDSRPVYSTVAEPITN